MPVFGVRKEILGRTVKGAALLAVPLTVTRTFPVLTFWGANTVMLFALQLEAVPALTPLKVMVLAPWLVPKLLPLMVITVPTIPEAGDNVEIVGEAVPGTSEIAALADFVESAALVAVNVTVCAALIGVGAVYSPEAEIVPVPAGLIVQVTAVFVEPVTVDVNCCVCAANSDALAGVTVTVTGGFKVTVAVADLVVSATLVAVMVTVLCAAIDGGAV